MTSTLDGPTDSSRPRIPLFCGQSVGPHQQTPRPAEYGYVMAYGGARDAAELAVIAEEHGWDGFLRVWDSIWQPAGHRTAAKH
jgi:hypothetical protein